MLYLKWNFDKTNDYVKSNDIKKYMEKEKENKTFIPVMFTFNESSIGQDKNYLGIAIPIKVKENHIIFEFKPEKFLNYEYCYELHRKKDKNLKKKHLLVSAIILFNSTTNKPEKLDYLYFFN